MITFIDWLLLHREDTRVHPLLEGLRIFVVPSLNPDGASRALDHYGICNSSIGSNNAQGIDLDSSFSGDTNICNVLVFFPG